MIVTRFALAASVIAVSTAVASAETLTIATVNNGDMIRMQKLADDFTANNPDIELEWVTLEENALRQKVTTDIATKGGQYDVMTIGTCHFSQVFISSITRSLDLWTIWFTANGAAGRSGFSRLCLASSSVI